MTPAAKSMFQAALLALSLAVSGVCLAWFGQQARVRATLETKAAAALLGNARAHLQTLRAPEVERLARQLAELEAQGFFAAATRESLSSRLQAARIALGLVETRAVFSPAQHWGDGATPLWQNELELEFDLNHEQEVIDFWRIIEWPGPLRVIDCALERNPTHAAAHTAPSPYPAAPAANLKAACRLQWLAGSRTAEDGKP